MNHEKITDIVGILVSCSMVAAMCFKVGEFYGRCLERHDATKAGVAHYIADADGAPKFEYLKK